MEDAREDRSERMRIVVEVTLGEALEALGVTLPGRSPVRGPGPDPALADTLPGIRPLFPRGR